MPRAEPKQNCDVLTRARHLMSAADDIQRQLLFPEQDPLYKKNEHRLRTKARARDNKDVRMTCLYDMTPSPLMKSPSPYIIIYIASKSVCDGVCCCSRVAR